MQNVISNYIAGQWTPSTGKETVEIINPATEEVIGLSPLGKAEDVNSAVQAATKAFLQWSQTPVIDRVQPLFKLKMLLEENIDFISTLIVQENGKTFKEAKGDILRGIQMVETACGMPSLMMGEALQNIANEIDCTATRRPLGVFAAITPFNFPAMVPFWFWPFAVAAGNTFVLKPSERVPLTQMFIFELIEKVGFPPGVINLVHGAVDVVNALCDHPQIEGISFVGSTAVAKHVYTKGTSSGKRVQALGGAKNYMVLMPDASMESSVKAMVDSCYGCAGERCLAGSILIGVGEAYSTLKNEVLKQVKNVVTGNGLDSKTTLGPVISKQAKQRIIADIETAIKEGAEILIDGRQSKHVSGYFLEPTVLDNIRPGTLMATKEIFGPVIGLMKANSLEEAIEILNSSNYANTTSLFTNSGKAAREFSARVSPTMVGINLGVPAPMAFFSFGGAKESFFGDVKVHGSSACEFFTERHTTMIRWFNEEGDQEVSPLWKN
ncbi:MAG: CoA-acylating methylmalonate-semialdehyde dehydrogenase [Halobacteriovoraceae bacterium]|nr:CoA-acylating methylmalonate-semialdehyde dehydrogenase [Halobacteriovoraceae bacterium]MCB9095258.1 CoA-acylating methylmalonate-semialdehyde dehydrogenase [Halobacteriovoraceae bacterium]